MTTGEGFSVYSGIKRSHSEMADSTKSDLQLPLEPLEKKIKVFVESHFEEMNALFSSDLVHTHPLSQEFQNEDRYVLICNFVCNLMDTSSPETWKETVALVNYLREMQLHDRTSAFELLSMLCHANPVFKGFVIQNKLAKPYMPTPKETLMLIGEYAWFLSAFKMQKMPGVMCIELPSDFNDKLDMESEQELASVSVKDGVLDGREVVALLLYMLGTETFSEELQTLNLYQVIKIIEFFGAPRKDGPGLHGFLKALPNLHDAAQAALSLYCLSALDPADKNSGPLSITPEHRVVLAQFVKTSQEDLAIQVHPEILFDYLHGLFPLLSVEDCVELIKMVKPISLLELFSVPQTALEKEFKIFLSYTITTTSTQDSCLTCLEICHRLGLFGAMCVKLPFKATNAWLEAIASSAVSASIKHLELFSVDITDDGLAHLHACSSLERLIISNGKGIYGKSLEKLPVTIRHLKLHETRLSLYYTGHYSLKHGFDYADGWKFSPLNGLAHLQHLRSLTVTNLYADEEFLPLCRVLNPLLEELCLEFGDNKGGRLNALTLSEMITFHREMREMKIKNFLLDNRSRISRGELLELCPELKAFNLTLTPGWLFNFGDSLVCTPRT